MQNRQITPVLSYWQDSQTLLCYNEPMSSTEPQVVMFLADTVSCYNLSCDLCMLPKHATIASKLSEELRPMNPSEIDRYAAERETSSPVLHFSLSEANHEKRFGSICVGY
jgi:hypothetical protein